MSLVRRPSSVTPAAPQGASKIVLQSKLNNARSAARLRVMTARSGNLPEGAAESIRVRVRKLGVVPGIEEFGSELDRLPLGDAGPLCEREVPVVDSGTAQRVSPHVAESEKRNSSAVQVCGVKVEVACGGGAVGVGGQRAATGSGAGRRECVKLARVVENLHRPRNVRP